MSRNKQVEAMGREGLLLLDEESEGCPVCSECGCSMMGTQLSGFVCGWCGFEPKDFGHGGEVVEAVVVDFNDERVIRNGKQFKFFSKNKKLIDKFKNMVFVEDEHGFSVVDRSEIGIEPTRT